MKMQLTCKLTSPELQKRRSTVIAELKTLIQSRQMLTDGLAFTLPSDDKVLDKLIDFVKSERLCCEFFSYRLIIDAGHATLEIRGPEDTIEFLEHEVGF
jgi:hypothetical protein